jgi:hypothetical protein
MKVLGDWWHFVIFCNDMMIIKIHNMIVLKINLEAESICQYQIQNLGVTHLDNAIYYGLSSSLVA